MLLFFVKGKAMIRWMTPYHKAELCNLGSATPKLEADR